jgi:hypothetical protein
MYDLAAILLALLAIVFRLRDEPKAAAIAGYSSAGCSWLAARRARIRQESVSR